MKLDAEARSTRLFIALALATSVAGSTGLSQGPAGGAARVTGAVYDSILMRPLSDAVIQLAGITALGTIGDVRTTQSDSLGRFDFTDIGPGTYLLGFQHVAVDSLGLRSPVQRLDIRSANTVRTSLAVPSIASIIRSVCGRSEQGDSLAVMLGSVRDARRDAPLPGAFVSLRWGEVVISRGGTMERSTPIVDTFANDEGWYTACVPGAVPLTIRATHDNDASGSVELRVEAHSIRRRDLYVGPADALVAAPDSSRPGGSTDTRIVERGTGSAAGTVRSINGAPVAGARVALLNGVGEARTNARGEFVLPNLPQGTHTIEARALGYVPGQAVVDIVDFRREPAEFVLEDISAFLLDTVRVAAVQRLEAATRVGFERRRKMGNGYFVDETVLDTMRATSFKDLVRRIPGIQFTRGRTPGDFWKEYVEFTLGGRSAPCLPVIYLDGTQLLQTQNDIDAIINPGVVRRIEVYHRTGSIPAEFRVNEACGVLAIWTGARRSG